MRVYEKQKNLFLHVIFGPAIAFIIFMPETILEIFRITKPL